MSPFPGFAVAREMMTREQLAERGITDARVLTAMARAPRERFVPLEDLSLAYGDRALPIECDQTISQPYIVALMTQALELAGGESVLEIGTGSGYQAAVLPECGARVVSVERHPELSAHAGQILSALGHRDIKLVVGNGARGWPPRAPYDRIIVTAAASEVPPALWSQLNDGGILVIPVGDEEAQALLAIRKTAGQPQSTTLCPCRFVPLIAKTHGAEQA